MAVAMIDGDEKKTRGGAFHDFLFLGMSSGGDSPSARVWASETGGGRGEASAASAGASSVGHGIVSEMDSGKCLPEKFEGIKSYNRQGDASFSLGCSNLSGQKRASSDLALMGFLGDVKNPVTSNYSKDSQFMKVSMFGKEVLNEWPKQSNKYGMMFPMQPPLKPISSSLTLHYPVSSRHDQFDSQLERPISNVGQMLHHTSRLSQGWSFTDRLSSCTFNESNSGAVVVSQAAADESSRTGNKGTGILKAINSSSVSTEWGSTKMLPCSNKLSVNSQVAEPESSKLPSSYGASPGSRQMTIFYAGQAHVFDDVHPNKADVIMRLAGSSGASWCTTSAKYGSGLLNTESKAPLGKEKGALSQNLNERLSFQLQEGSKVPLLRANPQP